MATRSARRRLSQPRCTSIQKEYAKVRATPTAAKDAMADGRSPNISKPVSTRPINKAWVAFGLTSNWEVTPVIREAADDSEARFLAMGCVRLFTSEMGPTCKPLIHPY